MAYSKKWEDMMVFYGEAHQNPINMLTHIVGVPIILTSVLAACSLLFIGHVNIGWLVMLGLIIYYISLDRLFGFAIMPMLFLLQLGASGFAGIVRSDVVLTYSAVGFFGGYALQFIGHAIEGKKPSLVTNPVKAMVTAPLFLVAEIFHKAGARRELFRTVENRIAALES